jgi:hypothetical protein
MQVPTIFLIIFIFIKISKYPSIHFIIEKHNKNTEKPLEADLVNFVFKRAIVTLGR